MPGTKSFDKLTAASKGHYAPKLSIIAECFHFHQRRQAFGESVADFTADIHRLASTCELGDYLDEEALRDQFVCGFRIEGMCKWLVAETTLTLKQDVDTGMEAGMEFHLGLGSEVASIISSHGDEGRENNSCFYLDFGPKK